MIAYFSESKAITIHINNFNEQYLDIAALALIWTIVIIGLIFMIRFMREKVPQKKSVFSFEKVPSISKSNMLYGINFHKDKGGFIGYISKPAKDLESESNEEI